MLNVGSILRSCNIKEAGFSELYQTFKTRKYGFNQLLCSSLANPQSTFFGNDWKSVPIHFESID